MKLKQFIDINIGRGERIVNGQFRVRIRLFHLELVVAVINWKRVKLHENHRAKVK
jgi:hypothetical protein